MHRLPSQVHDIVRTPVGLLGTVLGVKYDSASDKESGRLWVRYNNGHEAPLEPRAGVGNIQAMGGWRAALSGAAQRSSAQLSWLCEVCRQAGALGC